VIGGVEDAGRLRALPVFGKAAVDAVGALGRLQEGEGDAALLGRLPVDIAVPLGNVDAVNLMAVRAAGAEILRVLVGETRRKRAGDAEVVIRGGAGRRQKGEGQESQNQPTHGGPVFARLPILPRMNRAVKGSARDGSHDLSRIFVKLRLAGR
jgi:hypothetical protein